MWCSSWIVIFFASTHSHLHSVPLALGLLSGICIRVCAQCESIRVVPCRVAFPSFRVFRCVFAILLNWKHRQKIYGQKFFLKNVCVCVSTENWLKCSDIVWIMSIDKSSLLFVVFFSLSISFSLSPPALALHCLFSSVCSSFHLIFFFSVRRTEATQTHVYIYKLCTLRHTELLLVWFWLDVHYVTEKNDRGYDSCSRRARVFRKREKVRDRLSASQSGSERETDRYELDSEAKKQ